MKRFISLLSIVLALSLLAAGCQCEGDAKKNKPVIELSGPGRDSWLLFADTAYSPNSLCIGGSPTQDGPDLVWIDLPSGSLVDSGQFNNQSYERIPSPFVNPDGSFNAPSGKTYYFQAVSASQVDASDAGYVFSEDVKISNFCTVTIPSSLVCKLKIP